LHLDARLKFSTQTLLKEFATKYGSTIIYVTHDYREALALSDRIAFLRKGSIEQEGTPYEIFNTPGTDFVGNLVGEPPMNLIDGEIVVQDGKTLFRVGEEFIVPIPEALKLINKVPAGKRTVALGYGVNTFSQEELSTALCNSVCHRS
jgi:ABC-type sugar transport system ATPase subunit